MARNRGPGNLVARRPITEARVDARAHDSYADMIESDLGGRRTTSYRAIDEGRPASTAELLLRPLSLFLFACTGFVIVLLLWLWQAGVFGQLRLGERPARPAPSTSWIGARQSAVLPASEAPTEPATTAPAPAESGAAEDDANDEPQPTDDAAPSE